VDCCRGDCWGFIDFFTLHILVGPHHKRIEDGALQRNPPPEDVFQREKPAVDYLFGSFQI
jgi:hypothetical protein